MLEKFKDHINKGEFTFEKIGHASRYSSEIVFNFWNDLLITAARQQRLSEPYIQPFMGKKIPIGIIDGIIVLDISITHQTFFKKSAIKRLFQLIYRQGLSHKKR